MYSGRLKKLSSQCAEEQMQSACYSFRNFDESYFFIIICTYFTNYILSYAHLKIKLSHACADSEVNITK